MSLTHEHSSMAMNSISHAALMVQHSIQNAAECHAEPSAIYRPKIYRDGDQWCALYGDNLQDGVSGFGDSPAQAMQHFNKCWYETINTGGAV